MLAITREQVAAAASGDWLRVRALMARREPAPGPCPAEWADEYWGAHQALRELLGARLVALEAEIVRLSGMHRGQRPAAAPVLVDRRD